MTGRRYRVGQAFHRDGVHYRIVAGHKSPADQRLEWRVNGEWIPVSLEHVALVLAIIGENEAHLYDHASGNGKVVKFAMTAIRYGHAEANYWLAMERARKRGQTSTVLAMLRQRGLRELRAG
jgi:hypothetical protein